MSEIIVVKERHWRSFAKGLSWRVTGTCDTILISWLVTGHFKMALSIGLIEVFTKIVLYYFHERIWNKIKVGRIVEKQQDYNI